MTSDMIEKAGGLIGSTGGAFSGFYLINLIYTGNSITSISLNAGNLINAVLVAAIGVVIGWFGQKLLNKFFGHWFKKKK